MTTKHLTGLADALAAGQRLDPRDAKVAAEAVRLAAGHLAGAGVADMHKHATALRSALSASQGDEAAVRFVLDSYRQAGGRTAPAG